MPVTHYHSGLNRLSNTTARGCSFMAAASLIRSPLRRISTITHYYRCVGLLIHTGLYYLFYSNASMQARHSLDAVYSGTITQYLQSMHRFDLHQQDWLQRHIHASPLSILSDIAAQPLSSSYLTLALVDLEYLTGLQIYLLINYFRRLILPTRVRIFRTFFISRRLQ